MLAAIALSAPTGVQAREPEALPGAHAQAARIMSAEVQMSQALVRLKILNAQGAPAAPLDRVRWDIAVESAKYAYRVAARAEQARLYEIAGYASVQASVMPLLPDSVAQPFGIAIDGLHSIYILAGIDQYYLVNPHFNHRYTDAKPVDTLRAYYLEAQQRYGVDASYLASINYIESNFGRVNGPSSAGALGPMQFLPGTWANYGNGGNVNDPHDAILAAARYLVHYGAPYDMRTAIWHYNLDYNYVDAVEDFARAYRADPRWLDRMYYWNTFG